ncbi:N-acetylmuramoyl-L-alanine amidase [Galbibacter pacificus]|uniref:N-acetylmuramoyl-L-alanine amidase n=1 Tax=Galbibacter pacificus TaxID=2996052 RepID=A0ABT6FM95_9FLAO|nr:peptidoglycan recognition family protein [Galbibacter pacificus]MDG3580910.1 peptidoglycan recognition family protein [Galbibacter pacificus]MDG3584388.1 peptidoglycan recognition family protein [Galbibacter pacificus]
MLRKLPNYLIVLGSLLCTVTFVTSCKPAMVHEKIIFNEQRNKLSLQYLKERYHMVQDTPTIVPRMVVVHWTAIPTFQKSFDAFYEPTLPPNRKGISGAGTLNVSSQFLIDRDGTIYQLMPETLMARHVIGLNYCAIGIENVGGTKSTPLTDEQLKSNIRLIKYLKKKYTIDYVIGHYEYTLFENTDLWRETDANYRTEKTDPGEEFMEKIRYGVRKLDLKPLPTNN